MSDDFFDPERPRLCKATVTYHSDLQVGKSLLQCESVKPIYWIILRKPHLLLKNAAAVLVFNMAYMREQTNEDASSLGVPVLPLETRWRLGTTLAAIGWRVPPPLCRPHYRLVPETPLFNTLKEI